MMTIMQRLLAVLLLSMSFMAGAWAEVNVNTASVEELQQVKGIGPSKAQAIVDYRKANGPFKSLDDLTKVKGIGDKTVDKMRGELTLSGGGNSKGAAKTQPQTQSQPKP